MSRHSISLKCSTDSGSEICSVAENKLQKGHICGSIFADCNCGPKLNVGSIIRAPSEDFDIDLQKFFTTECNVTVKDSVSKQVKNPIKFDCEQKDVGKSLSDHLIQQRSASENPTHRSCLLLSYSQPDIDYLFTEKNQSLSKNKSYAKSLNELNMRNLEESLVGTSALIPDTKIDNSVNNIQDQNTGTVQSATIDKNKDFEAAQKFFAESGILGTTRSNDLIRETSKVLQNPHVIEKIRKTSLVLQTLNSDQVKKRSLESCSPLVTPRARKNYLVLHDKNVAGSDYYNQNYKLTPLEDIIKMKDSEIFELRLEVHRLKSLLRQSCRPGDESMPINKFKIRNTERLNFSSEGKFNIECFALSNKISCPHFSPISEKNTDNKIKNYNLRTTAQASNPPMLKKQGVSAESCELYSMNTTFYTPIPKFHKDFNAKQLIKDAIMDNDFLKNIDVSQVRELVDSMWHQHIPKGEFLIREGEVGAHLYVAANGQFEVIQNDKIISIFGAGKAFGELAILYHCTRTASIRVVSDDAYVWVLDRRIFQKVMMRTGLQRIENSIQFLKSVPLLKHLSQEVLAKMADVLEVEFYESGTYIIRQAATGDTFFIISQGTVKVTQKQTPSNKEVELRRLCRGDYFGEQALINEDKRTANIIALSPGVECLTLDRESFLHLIGDLCELKEKCYDDKQTMLAKKNADMSKEIFNFKVKQEFSSLKIEDLEIVATLGLGGFGRVELVKAYQKNSINIFALKCLKKQHIVDTKQEDHVFSERTIMLACDSPFICRLYRTFRDNKYVYMLLEACMGGEIWTMLRDRGTFTENAAQFIVGCVLQAFDFLHKRGIIYRDLKPENLMLDQRGYVKLVDFGFAKFIGFSNKTWTFCGTPEYVAPEIILNKGHDRATDYWALGILIHELLNGVPPFTANDPMNTYNKILKGIDMILLPKSMSRSATQLIKKLCRQVPAERLGYQKAGMQDIKKHKWFLGFDWDSLESQTLCSPFARPLTHVTDTCYFDRFPSDTNEPPDENSGWDLEF